MYKEKLKANMRYKTLIETIEQMYEGFVLSSIDGRIFYANKAVEHISGIELKYIVGKTSKELEEEGLIKLSTKVKSKAPITMIHKVKNGREIFITSKPIYDENGHIICFAANYRNMKTLHYLQGEHLDTNKLPKQLEKSHLNLEGWIGDSYVTNRLKEKVAKIAKTEALVLILGDSGTGKEVVANNIHLLSHRKDHTYLRINCAAIPKDLFEEELFGYEKGAFVGAETPKEGLFESADGGTVLLDEIGDMPLNMQVKLLRVIQTKKVMRIGGTKEKLLDIRFIAATNKNLEELIKSGEFREDLYYRLNVVPIQVPSLQERKEDIVPLCDYYLDEYNQIYNMKKVLTAETLQLLQEFDWPGNVRQLKNIIERLVIITEEEVISPDFLPEEFKVKHHLPIYDIQPLKTVTEEAEVNIIKLAIKKYGTLRKAAQVLEVHHSTLIRKIKKYNINI